ncbi:MULTISPECIES: DUF4229 domain-containing protein [unclassified Gordonia (in: high G+C Gram-positive bacteria)]|uniref:DUF4229 domain-containing protein n=1 Tax=unclassified Gordonia (in: high G+C Gram-positive bacteria) TaxID=2657482 RepID=UPI002000383F|nr:MULTISPECIES: DUF4229 domain-containing protein [unclassified Gordonia (in: high G+C Gram-positive bacteria)]UQE74591.1 DUF4229 domain-containing protein [Gordonia sp. PP30]
MTDDQAGSARGDLSSTDEAPAKKATIGSLIGWIALYSAVRLGLVVVIALLIIGVGLLFGVKVWVVAALAFGVVIAIPLGMVLFKPLRLKVNAQITEIDADRAARKSDLHARLRGDGQ